MADNNKSLNNPIQQLTESEELLATGGTLVTYELANGKFLIAPEGKVEHETLAGAQGAIAELEQSKERRERMREKFGTQK